MRISQYNKKKNDYNPFIFIRPKNSNTYPKKERNGFIHNARRTPTPVSMQNPRRKL